MISELFSQETDVLLELSDEKETYIRSERESDRSTLVDLIVRTLAVHEAISIRSLCKSIQFRNQTALTIFTVVKLIEQGVVNVHFRDCETGICTVHFIGQEKLQTTLYTERTVKWCDANYLISNSGYTVICNPLIRIEVRVHNFSHLEPIFGRSRINIRKLPSPVCKLANILFQTGFLHIQSICAEDDWRVWDFHDLLFHARTRRRDDRLVRAGTYQRQSLVPREDADLTNKWGEVYRDTEAAIAPNLARDLFNGRQTIRGRRGEIGPRDMLAMLGTLRRFSIAEHDAATAPVIRNRCNYPSAGALDELEYFWVHDGSGQLRAGVYHFNKSHLSLEEVSVDQEAVDVLLKRAMLTWGKENGRPRGLIVITADYIKVASKYQNIAYRLSLLNAGVALQSIYLAASLANIGVCALGTGDSLEFSRVSRVRESSHFALCEIAVAGAL